MNPRRRWPRRLRPEELGEIYLAAKERVIASGFSNEVDWQEEVSLDRVTEQTFLRESAWVVLSAGFRESVVRARFASVSQAFLDWVSADAILVHRETCRENALLAFGNRRKIDAILEIVARVAEEGFDRTYSRLLREGRAFLERLPYIGPVTSWHLAKNLGLPVVKPDRHLVRLAANAGYNSPLEMCKVIAEVVGDPLPVIDIVLWRCASISGPIPIFLDESSEQVGRDGVVHKEFEAKWQIPPGETLRPGQALSSANTQQQAKEATTKPFPACRGGQPVVTTDATRSWV